MLRFSKTASPMVVWNVTRKCNLSCAHCYINAVGPEEANPEEDMGELTTREAKEMIDDLVAIKSPMLVFSGGEPLLRDDIYELNVYAMKLGLRTILSTNSTLDNQGSGEEDQGSRLCLCRRQPGWYRRSPRPFSGGQGGL